LEPPGWELLVARHWPMLIALLVLFTAFALNASGTLLQSESVLLDLVKAGVFNLIGASILTAAVGGLIGTCWKSKVRLEVYLAIFCALFLAFATSQATYRIVNPPPPEGDPGYPDSPYDDY